MRYNIANLHVPLGFALWYALNVAYNITNKWALEEVRVYVDQHTSSQSSVSALPLTIGCIQFGIGAIYACTLWMLGWRRPVPHADELTRATTAVSNCISKLCKNTASLMRLDHLVGQWLPWHYAPLTSHHAHPHHTSKEYTAQANHDSPSDKHSSLPFRSTFNIAVHHTLGQLCTIISLSSNSISFAHIIKAMEPFFSALASRFVLGHTMDIRVYLSLLPVVGGVIMACAGSREFSWISFWSAMGANAFFAMRGVVSKMAMEGHSHSTTSSMPKNSTSDNETTYNENNGDDDDDLEHGEKEHGHKPSTSPANLFAAVTCVSFLLSIPLALLFEGHILRVLVTSASPKDGIEGVVKSEGHGRIIMHIVLSGLFHYLNNEVMYIVLSNVHPITLAVGNTFKRIFVIVAGVLVFSTPVTLQTAIGSAIGIGGVFVYSMMKQWYGSTSDSKDSNTGSDSYCAKVQ